MVLDVLLGALHLLGVLEHALGQRNRLAVRAAREDRLLAGAEAAVRPVLRAGGAREGAREARCAGERARAAQAARAARPRAPRAPAAQSLASCRWSMSSWKTFFESRLWSLTYFLAARAGGGRRGLGRAGFRGGRGARKGRRGRGGARASPPSILAASSSTPLGSAIASPCERRVRIAFSPELRPPYAESCGAGRGGRARELSARAGGAGRKGRAGAGGAAAGGAEPRLVPVVDVGRAAHELALVVLLRAHGGATGRREGGRGCGS